MANKTGSVEGSLVKSLFGDMKIQFSVSSTDIYTHHIGTLKCTETRRLVHTFVEITRQGLEGRLSSTSSMQGGR